MKKCGLKFGCYSVSSATAWLRISITCSFHAAIVQVCGNGLLTGHLSCKPTDLLCWCNEVIEDEHKRQKKVVVVSVVLDSLDNTESSKCDSFPKLKERCYVPRRWHCPFYL